MNKVTTINLNGKAYRIEEAGYEALRKYLDQATAKLADNPDKDEIMADFEQAFADKCDGYLRGHKDVISATEIDEIIKTMGPVDATGGAGAADATVATKTTESKNGPKRLFQIRQGAWIAGVCNGLAAYFNLDVTIIRVIFAIFTTITHGFGVGLYIILAIVMPVARTEEEFAQARGEAPFNAHDFIEQAKQRYAEFQKNHPHIPSTPSDPHNREEWHKWKDEMKQWKRELKADMHRERMRRRYGNEDYKMQSAGVGFFRFLLGLVITGLFIAWILSLWSIVVHGTVLGITLVGAAAISGPGHILWVPILFLTALFYLIMLPLKLLMKNARPQHWNRYSFFNDLVQSIFFVFAIYVLIYTARILFPFVNEVWSVIIAQIHAR